MQLTPELAEALAQSQTFPALLQAIYEARYTGKLVLDCYCGVPQQVELPQPPPTPVRVKFGKARRRHAPATPTGD